MAHPYFLRLRGIDAVDVTRLGLSVLLQKLQCDDDEQLANALAGIAMDNSLLLLFTVSSCGNLSRERLLVTAQAVFSGLGRSKVGERVRDYFRLAPTARSEHGDMFNTLSVALGLLFVVMLDKGMHETILEEHCVFQHLVSNYWYIAHKTDIPSIRDLLSDRVLSAIAR